ncbi:MAG TPA: DUF1415 domain-containing protein [Burkholderiales bacterium]|nr:DUF1415 domain-containing protein [Burkholderiales bacterium]
MNQPADTEAVIAATRDWLEKAVIGLGLCPFAKAVHAKGQIRYVVSAAQSPEALVEDLMAELRTLEAADPAAIDTTLLVHPGVLADFADYNDFLDIADALLDELELTGIIQIASFHPEYRFEGTMKDAIENYTNRSPYPMLHLLREDSIERAVTTYPDVADIPEKNIETMNRLGIDGWQALMAKK